MTSPSMLSLQITSLCRMGWCYNDSYLWAADIDGAIPADELPELKVKLEQIPDLTDRRLAFLETLGLKRDPRTVPITRISISDDLWLGTRPEDRPELVRTLGRNAMRYNARLAEMLSK